MLFRSAADANFEVLRSDVVRKELTAGRVENIYTDVWTERTYAELLARAEKLFWQGRRVLIDANFRQDSWRRRFLDAARRWCVPALFVQCQAQPAVIQQRLAARHNDASDADGQVYQLLELTWQPLSDEVQRVTVALNPGNAIESCKDSVFHALAGSGIG